MRNVIATAMIVLFFGQTALGQNQYEVSTGSNGEKTFKGIISREALESEASFKWYADNQKNYTPNQVGLNALKQYGDSLQLIVFMGTWCEDSHSIIPKFFSLVDASGFAANRITLLGTDRAKKTLSHLAEALDVKNVPTILIMKNGKELGRVVEYGKYGMWDKELGEIINLSFAR